MSILYIDTATNDSTYAIDTQSGFFVETHTGDRDTLVPDLFDFVEKYTQLSEIGSVVVVNGPGMFTGIRVGCLIANAFKAAQMGRPQIYTINTLMAQIAPGVQGSCYSVVPAGKTESYLAHYIDAVRQSEIQVVKNEELVGLESQVSLPAAQRILIAKEYFDANLLSSFERALPLYVKGANITIKKTPTE